MDPMSMLISALTTGAVVALQETAGTAVKDAYQGLVNLIGKRFSTNSKAKAALEGYKEDPETWKKPLEKSIRETNLAEDQEVLVLAQKLLQLTESQKPSAKYDVKVTGNVQGLVQGDHATVSMNFDETTKGRKKKKS
jgi:hypothetical protein